MLLRGRAVRLLPALITGFWLLDAPPVVSQVYRWIDDKGVAHYTQGLDSVPERYRTGAVLPFEERVAALETLRVLQDLYGLTRPDVEASVYAVRLNQARSVVVRALGVMSPGPVRSTLASAFGYYESAKEILQWKASPQQIRYVLARVEMRCPRISGLLAQSPGGGIDVESAVGAARECASDMIAHARQLLEAPAPER